MNNFYKNKKILITGHTGFKGSWLSCILNSYGANIFGISDGKINSLIYKKKIAEYKIKYFFDLKEKKKIEKIITKIKLYISPCGSL